MNECAAINFYVRSSNNKSSPRRPTTTRSPRSVASRGSTAGFINARTHTGQSVVNSCAPADLGKKPCELGSAPHGSRRAAEHRDKFPPPHSITSSARANSDGGTLRPSALAALRLMTNSNLVGCTIGRSAGRSNWRRRFWTVEIYARAPVEIAQPHELSRLRARRERPSRRRAAESRDELAPLHSITSSARARSVGGTVRPMAFAAFKLMTRSYLVGACTGRSAGLSPFRMRSA